ncbi:MFS transporter [Marinimicrobium sp. C2-29]|uniref:MFS transporter n=1 Tax=Marinimicrobium sp. C2-29 TaxID=3139825 RepID=UPI0031391426
MNFYHPLAFWLGCIGITLGVLSQIPMFLHAAPMGYHMAGMPMSTTMLVGMALIPLGLLLSGYGVLPRLAELRHQHESHLQFHIADRVPLNAEHWKLVIVLWVAVTVDVMKPATLGFVMPGMASEYQLTSQSAGALAVVALTGTTVGSVLWGMAADRFGRRAAILLSALMFIGTAICGAMPSYTWNLIMCFLMGLSAGGLLPITFALMAESIPAKHRGWLLVALGGLGTAAGYLVAAGSATLLEPTFSWRILWLLGLPTGLLVIFLNRYIPESPRYLASKGLNHEARHVLARFSGNAHQDSEVVVEPEPESAPGGFGELFKAPYVGITLGLITAGVAWGLVNFGFLLWLPTNLHALGLAEHANSLVAQSAFFALPGVALVIWLYHHWSSIHTLTLFSVLTAAALLIFALCSLFGWLTLPVLTVCTALLLTSASGIIAMLIPYASEIYPVHLRGTGAGIVAASSKLGGIGGTLLGVSGLLDSLTASALVIATPLFGAALLLGRNGIDTRGLHLEDIRRAMRRKTQDSVKS